MANNIFTKKQPDLDRPYRYFDRSQVPPDARIVRVLGVDYVHLRTKDGGDLYVTRHGLPLLPIVRPEHWYYDPARKKDRDRLNGSGTLYRVHNRRTGKGNTDIVIKWSRIGQEVPGPMQVNWDEVGNQEFNSPFEEFALLMEMRGTRRESPGVIRTHKPLAIYVPAERIAPERMGRHSHKFDLKMRSVDVELDLYRQYIVIYEWVKGVDSAEAAEKIGMDGETLKDLVLSVEEDMKAKGFRDHDRKPNHIIVRPKDKDIARVRKTGKPLYAYVDFEMLRRTPEREKWIKESKRAEYLIRQRDRFDPAKPRELPPHLHLVNILGVDYIYGAVESTGGALWVVGRDPFLFDYFLPERWRRTPRKKISHQNEHYHTTTKDDIHVVWRVSRIGEKPDFFEQDEKHQRIVDHGYNSPFEEVSLALELSRRGLPTIYPRAIYRAGYEVTASEYISDNRRYETHRGVVMPDGIQALQRGFNYISVWGYWNGPDELLAVRDGEYYSGVNLLHAYIEKIITKETFDELMKREQEKLLALGIVDLNLRAEHFMISLDNKGNLRMGRDGMPEVRCSNFEFLQRTYL